MEETVDGVASEIPNGEAEPRPEKRPRHEDAPPSRRRRRSIRTPLIHLPSMQDGDVKRSYWSALYELWRLSWYQIPHDHAFAPAIQTCREATDYGVVKHTTPQPVFMWDWLKAVDHGDMLLKSLEFESLFPIDLTAYTRLRKTAPDEAVPGATALAPSMRQRCEAWYGETAAALERARLSPLQLAQIAGALIKTGMIGTRLRNNSVCHADARTTDVNILVYYIDPVVAVNLQRFINTSPLMAFNDPLRPGHEGCGDQLASIHSAHARGPVPHITQFNDMMARRHLAWAKSALDHSTQLAEAEIDSARRHYPL